MTEGPGGEPSLLDALVGLAHPHRLHLLRQLQQPRALGEIEVPMGDERGNLTRQAVRRHLDHLLALRIVEARDAQRAYGDTVEYVVNHRALFALSERVRALARYRPAVEIDQETLPAPATTTGVGRGAVLVQVKGLDEGLTFDVAPVPERREWIVGRSRESAVSLDFDPYVSAENTLLRWVGDRHEAEDVPGSLNGTRVNFRRLAPRERAELRHGDLLSVGRTHLLYWRR